MDRDSQIYQHHDFTAMQGSIAAQMPASFGGLAFETVLGDWLQDCGIEWPKWAEVVEPPTLSMYLPNDYYGRGRGSGRGRSTIVEIGKCYLVISVDWFAWVGRVVRQVGPFEWEFESCSKISETNNGDNWQSLCEGNKAARKAASYQHYKVKVARNRFCGKNRVGWKDPARGS